MGRRVISIYFFEKSILSINFDILIHYFLKAMKSGYSTYSILSKINKIDH